MKKYQVAIIGTNIGAKHYKDFQKVSDRFNIHTLCGLTRESVDNILMSNKETQASFNFNRSCPLCSPLISNLRGKGNLTFL